jgi:hypothetical protein
LQLSGQGLAASVLQELGVTIERARPLLLTIAGASEQRPSADTALTPSAQKVIEGARREAVEHGALAAGTEHILLSLVRDFEGVLGRILLDLEASPQQIRLEVLRRIHPAINRARTVRLAPPGPGLHWHRAALLWRPEGLELRVPLLMSIAQLAAFAADEVWSNDPLAGLRREIWSGWLALASPTLLEDLGDPSELKRALDAAARRALDSAERDGGEAAQFLNRLRSDP